MRDPNAQQSESLPGFNDGQRSIVTEFAVRWIGAAVSAQQRISPATDREHARAIVDYASNLPHLGTGVVVARTVTTYTTDWIEEPR